MKTDLTYDAGEEIRVFRLAVIRTSAIQSPQPADIRINSPTFTGQSSGSTNSVQTNSTLMTIYCEVVLEGGGSDRKLGTTKVKLGNVGNLTADLAKVNYPVPTPTPDPPGHQAGIAEENPGGPLPMLDTGRLGQDVQSSGGEDIFRTGSRADDDSYSGGRKVIVSGDDNPDFGPWANQHPQTGNSWATTQGGYDFKEYIAAFTTSFPKYFVVLATGQWNIRYVGNKGQNGVWANTGSSAVIPPNNNTANLTISITNGAPQRGDDAQIQVRGLSFSTNFSITYKTSQ